MSKKVRPEEIEMLDRDVVNAMGALAEELSDLEIDESVRLGRAISMAMVTFQVPMVSVKVFKAVNQEQDGLNDEEAEMVLAIRARFALLGYVVRNFMLDGFTDKFNWMDPPSARASKAPLILGPKGLVN